MLQIYTVLGSPLGQAWVASLAVTAILTLAFDEWLRSAETGSEKRARKGRRGR